MVADIGCFRRVRPDRNFEWQEVVPIIGSIGGSSDAQKNGAETKDLEPFPIPLQRGAWRKAGFQKRYPGSNSTIYRKHGMLVLSHKKQQTVIVDGQLEIEVLKIKGNAVWLGITAPNSVKIIRGALSPFKIEMKMPEIVSEDVATYL